MIRLYPRALAAVPALICPVLAVAAPDAAIQELREQLKQLKEDYEKRIAALEERLVQAEAKAGSAETAAVQAQDTAQQAAHRPAGANAFNPAISLILAGTYTDLSQDPSTRQITGFVPPTGQTPTPRSFNLGESELSLAASVDPYFRGSFTAAITPENTVEVEEAYAQTSALPNGFGLKAGRFLSSVGYLNDQHAHVWEFADAPLPYKAFFGSQLAADGVQLKWVAPTETYLELGTEAGRFVSFPGTDTQRSKNGLMSGTLFAHVGGDAGVSNNWRTGLSYVQTSPQDRSFDTTASAFDPATGQVVDRSSHNSFSGRSETWIADLVWKWAPNGNPVETNFKLQGEYFQRRESGTLSATVAADPCGGSCSDLYDSRQSGWYLQGVYQFMPRWRVGLRYDALQHGSVDVGLIRSGTIGIGDLPVLQPYSPRRGTAMVDWRPSEFSLLRLQYARDESTLGETDNQIWLQYVMSLGAHGAHQF